MTTADRRSPGRRCRAWSACRGARTPLLAVWDAAYTESNILRIDVSDTPAVDHRFTDDQAWHGRQRQLRSGGHRHRAGRDALGRQRRQRKRQHAQPAAQARLDGNVLAEIGLPAEILACRAATTGTSPAERSAPASKG